MRMEACDFHRRSSPAYGKKNVSFLSFLPLSPWVLQYEWENYKFGFYPHSCFPSFILHLKGIAGQLYPGPSLGVLTQESNKLRASRSSTRASMGSASVRTSLRRIECATSILLDALETSGDLVYDLQSTTSIVSSMVHPMGRSGTWPSILREELYALGFASRLTSVQKMNKFLFPFSKKTLAFVCQITGIPCSSGVLCARYLSYPIITFTITDCVLLQT